MIPARDLFSKQLIQTIKHSVQQNLLPSLKDAYINRISRPVVLCFLGALIILVLTIPVIILERSKQTEVKRLRARTNEFSKLAAEYTPLAARIQGFQGRSTLTKTSGIAQVLEDMVNTLGMKDRLKSVKGSGSKPLKGDLHEESAEVVLEKLTMNEIVNLLHRLDTAPLMLSMKRFSLKKSFERPNLLDITMTLSLFTSTTMK
jgi:general secretion pathway protein M